MATFAFPLSDIVGRSGRDTVETLQLPYCLSILRSERSEEPQTGVVLCYIVRMRNSRQKMVDEATKKRLASIPLLRTRAGPRDGDQWATRLKEEYTSLIQVTLYPIRRLLSLTTSPFLQYVSQNKDSDNDWFRLESNKDGTRWFGKCWYIHNLLKYEFNVEFDVSGVRWSQVITGVVISPGVCVD